MTCWPTDAASKIVKSLNISRLPRPEHGAEVVGEGVALGELLDEVGLAVLGVQEQHRPRQRALQGGNSIALFWNEKTPENRNENWNEVTFW